MIAKLLEERNEDEKNFQDSPIDSVLILNLPPFLR